MSRPFPAVAVIIVCKTSAPFIQITYRKHLRSGYRLIFLIHHYKIVGHSDIFPVLLEKINLFLEFMRISPEIVALKIRQILTRASLSGLVNVQCRPSSGIFFAEEEADRPVVYSRRLMFGIGCRNSL